MKPRLWPALAIVLLAGLWLAKVWGTGDAIRQHRNTQTAATIVLAVLALTLWLAFFSRLSRTLRAVGVGVIVLAVGVFGTLFRVRGVTGDLVPVFETRWAPHPEAPSPPQAVRPPETRPSAPASAPTPVAAMSAPPPSRPAPPAPASDTDFPQFLGPARNGVLPGPRLARDFAARPPVPRWRRPVGEGWSGFAVVGNVAVTQEQWGGEERVVAYDAATGEPLWSHADEARYATVVAGVGPRAVPTITDGRVFTMGATGLVNALELATGRRLWAHDVLRENDATAPEWGKSCSPLVVDGRVVVSAGGAGGRSLVAFDAATGAPAWSAGSDGSSYSSPQLLTLAGRRQVVILNHGSLAGHDPQTGALLWEQPFPGAQPNVAVPLLLGSDRLLVSVGYGVGSKAYRIAAAGDALSAALEWESPRLKSKFANLVRHEGSVYGLDDGVLACLDPATGERRWKDGRYGHGQLLLVGGTLLVQTEEGEVVLVDPAADGLHERTRFGALEGKTWNPPALAGRLLVVRNDREAAAFELPVD